MTTLNLIYSSTTYSAECVASGKRYVLYSLNSTWEIVDSTNLNVIDSGTYIVSNGTATLTNTQGNIVATVSNVQDTTNNAIWVYTSANINQGGGGSGGSNNTPSTNPNLTSDTYEEDDQGNKTYFAKAFSITDDGKVKVTTTDGSIALSLDATFLGTLATQSDISSMLTSNDVTTLITNALQNHPDSASIQASLANFITRTDLSSLGVDVVTSGNIEGDKLKTGTFIEFSDGSRLGRDI